MDKHKLGKRILAMLCFVGTALLLGGCTAQLEERAPADLSQVAVEAGVDVPLEDMVDTKRETVVLYFLDEEGMELVPVSRVIDIENGQSRSEAALRALCAGPQEGEAGYFPEIGMLSTTRGYELSGGVATVDLPARLRALSPEEIYALRMAITHTLTEFSEVSYVNVLIGGREEGFDLAATMPMGTLSRAEDMDVASRYLRLDEIRQSAQDAGITRLTTLYFPSEDGRWILPEVRGITYASMEPIEYLYTILEEIGRGTKNRLSMDVPEPMKFIEEMPEIVRTEDGAYRAIEIRFNGELDEVLEDAGLTRGIYLAMLTDTLMGFIPGVEGLLVRIDGEQVTELSEKQTPDGKALGFEQKLATRVDFEGYVGAIGTVYLPARGQQGIEKTDCVFPEKLQFNARERLWQVTTRMMQIGSLTEGLEETDILAVGVNERCIAVNLSEKYAQAIAELTPSQESATIYAMVNTLTEGEEPERIVFFFEGEQRQTLAGGLEMRGEFLRNPGMVVDE